MGSTVASATSSAYPSGQLEARVTHRFVRVDGHRLHVLDFGGDGRPVLFLHGVGGSAWMWLAVASHLGEAGHRLLALDFRGYGDSQWSADQDYTTDRHVADVEGMLDALLITDVDVVGFSWGGLVAIALAARSSRLRRVAIVDVPPSFTQSETDIVPLAYDFAGEEAALEAERRLSPGADEATLTAAAAFAVRPAEGGHFVKKHDAFFALRWPFRSDDLWRELAALRQPALVVHAEQSKVLTAAVADRMVATLADGTLERISGTGHLVPLERPQALADAIRSFLA